MIQGLEHLPCEEKLRVGAVEVQGDLTAAFQYLKLATAKLDGHLYKGT